MVGSVSGINGETLKFEFMAVVNLLRLTARYSSKLHTHPVPVSDVSHMRATKSLFLPAICNISINTVHTRRKRLKRTILCRKGLLYTGIGIIFCFKRKRWMIVCPHCVGSRWACFLGQSLALSQDSYSYWNIFWQFERLFRDFKRITTNSAEYFVTFRGVVIKSAYLAGVCLWTYRLEDMQSTLLIFLFVFRDM